MSGIYSARIDAYIKRAASASTHYERGRNYENLLDYLMSSIPGCEVARNSLNHYGTEEADLSVSNMRLREGLPLLPEYFLVECKNAAGLVEAPNTLIMALLVLAAVLHADETATKVAGKKAWPHAACTQTLTLFTLAPRSKAGAAAGGVLPDFTGTMVHDALCLYRGFPDAEHQLCVAHVIPEITACDERFPGQVWAAQIRWALAEVIKVADAARTGGLDHIPPGRLHRWLIHYDAEQAPGFLAPLIEPGWDKRYGRNVEIGRVPGGKPAITALAETIGRGCDKGLAALWQPDAPAGLKALPQVEILRQVWVHHYLLGCRQRPALA
jgi:hypothetical protein